MNGNERERGMASRRGRGRKEEFRRQTRGTGSGDDTPGAGIAVLAAAGGAFDWLVDEPDLYDDKCGEPV